MRTAAPADDDTGSSAGRDRTPGKPPYGVVKGRSWRPGRGPVRRPVPGVRLRVVDHPAGGDRAGRGHPHPLRRAARRHGRFAAPPGPALDRGRVRLPRRGQPADLGRAPGRRRAQRQPPRPRVRREPAFPSPGLSARPAGRGSVVAGARRPRLAGGRRSGARPGRRPAPLGARRAAGHRCRPQQRPRRPPPRLGHPPLTADPAPAGSGLTPSCIATVSRTCRSAASQTALP